MTVVVEDLGDGVRVSVRDDGPGIPAHEHGRIFQQFARGEVAQSTGSKGLGLGLAVSKALIEAHGGAIWVESEPGFGATFRFTLPYAAP